MGGKHPMILWFQPSQIGGFSDFAGPSTVLQDQTQYTVHFTPLSTANQRLGST